MTRMVFCKRNQEEAEGLENAPLLGKIGQEILESTSQAAWEEWEEMQLKIINEYHLDLSEKKDRTVLADQMRTFLNLESKKAKIDGPDPLAVGTPTEEFYNKESAD
jgi:Fe-S cluster biosynthesis and repair protein YggX